MGGRVEGKTKKKSVKANVTSKFNSKRKASRMGKKVKKGQMGPNTEFITRSSALKKLQITLKDFRRLCILKGIYPRVPVKGLKGNDKVYYDIKDISYIMHEPLLQKFRDFKSFMKKIRKAAGRNQFGEARRKNELKPDITLDHLVKERYPRFIDALRDLDDALCMVHLFAAMPSLGRITADRTSSCSKLVREWQYYISKSRTLQKVFVSVKGVYFQAEIMGEPVTWLVPHQFTQAVPKEVDVRVMLTFLEFYEVFLQFVMYKLYNSQNMQYPPKVDKQLDQEGCFLLALKADRLDDASNPSTGDQQQQEGDAMMVVSTNNTDTSTKLTAKQAAAASAALVTKTSAAQLSTLPKLLKQLGKSNENDDDDEEDEEIGHLAAPLTQALNGLAGVVAAEEGKNNHSRVHEEDEDEVEQRTFASHSDDPLRRLFAPFVFFVNREVPLEWMQLCTVSFGAKIGWDGPQSPYAVDDVRITHQIVDRPQQGVQSVSREYVQPQWIFDCINAQMLLPVLNYRPGSKLPPHLSPFVDDNKEGYMPRYREEIKKLQSGTTTTGSKTVAVVVEDDENDDDEQDEEKQHMKAATTTVAAAAVVTSKQKQQENKKRKASSTSEEESTPASNGNNNSNSKANAAAVASTPASKKQKNVAATTTPVVVAATESSDEEEEDSEGENAANNNVLSDFVGKVAAAKGPKGVVFQPKQTIVSEAEEAADLSKIMMSKKTKRLYGRMQHGIEQKQAAIRTLESKRQAHEEQQSVESSPVTKISKSSGTKSSHTTPAKSVPSAVAAKTTDSKKRKAGK